MKKKVYISFLLSIILIFTNIHVAYCANPWSVIFDSTLDFLDDWNQYTQVLVENQVSNIFDSVGFLIDKTGVTLDKIRNALKLVPNSGITDSSSANDIGNYIHDNISVTDNSITYSESLNNFIINYNGAYINNYMYSYNYNNITNSLTQSQKDFIEVSQQTNFVFAYPLKRTNSGTSNSDIFIYLIPFSADLYFRNNSPSVQGSSLLMSSTSDDQLTESYIRSLGGKAYNGNLVDITSSTTNMAIGGYMTPNNDTSSFYNNNYLSLVSIGECKYSVYSTYTQINKPNNPNTENKYYNNSVWENFEDNSSGDYTVNSNNVNTVTYGDTINYINDYHDTNNNYPDNSTVNNWIENTNIENNTGGSGGDNGGGSGGSSSEGIFDFLSELGDVLGNLIKNLGQAITNIIKGISDLITSIVTDLPTVFFDFIGEIFGWLPDEWVTLMSLSLAAMLIWGIVKVIRG